MAVFMFNRKKSILLFSFLLLLVFLLGGLILQPHHQNQSGHTQLARDLLLTDLCLTTEARHTRRLSQPDFLTPFQDFPGGLDRFPSSTFLLIPAAEYLPSNTEEEK